MRTILKISIGFVVLAVGIGGYSLKTSGTLTPKYSKVAATVPVPRIRSDGGVMRIDGTLDEGPWSSAEGGTGAFERGERDARDGRATYRPTTDARLAHDDEYLYVGLRVLGPIEATARHTIALVFSGKGGQRQRFDATQEPPRCTVRVDPAKGKGACAAQVADTDAGASPAWVVEMAIPLEALGLTGASGQHTRLSIERCDAADGGGASCGTWGAEGGLLVLE